MLVASRNGLNAIATGCTWWFNVLPRFPSFPISKRNIVCGFLWNGLAYRRANPRNYSCCVEDLIILFARVLYHSLFFLREVLQCRNTFAECYGCCIGTKGCERHR